MTNKFSDGLNVLVYGDITKLTATMNHHFLDQLSCVSDDMTQEPKTIDELNDYIKKGGHTHVVVPDEHFHRLQGSLEKCVVPVVELLGDHYVPWAIERKRAYIQGNGIRHAFVFSDRFHEGYEGVQFHPLLNGFNSSTFFDQGGERDIDVLINGSMGNDTHSWVYPVRNWLAQVLPEIGVKEGIMVETHEHPGYLAGNGGIESYARILNRSKIAIGGSSRWRLPLKKFYEVPASGAILLSDLPLEDTDFFEGRILEVDPTRIANPDCEDIVRRNVMGALENYGNSRERLQPFRSEQDRFDRSYEGKALEMRAILETI